MLTRLEKSVDRPFALVAPGVVIAALGFAVAASADVLPPPPPLPSPSPSPIAPAGPRITVAPGTPMDRPDFGIAAGPAADRAGSIDCLAKAIAHEAGNEPESGQQAVAQVILNRAAHRAYPKSVCAVVFQGAERRTGCQFTFTCDGSLHRPLSRRVRDRAERVAIQAVDGQLPPTVGPATHYHAFYVTPRWAPALVRVATIGAHIFYRFPGSGDGSDLVPAAAPRAQAAASRPPGLFAPWGLAAPGQVRLGH